MTVMAENGVDAPVKKTELTPDDPWRWLAAGWRDMTRAPVLSLGGGFAVVGGGALILWTLWNAGLVSLAPVALGMFAIVGPLLALGFYEISRRLSEGETPRLFPVQFAGPRSPIQVAYIGFFLMFAALVWVRMAMLLYALFSAGDYMPLSDFVGFALSTGSGLAMIAVGTVFGGIIAFGIYVLTVVSIPMLMNEKTDPFTAISVGIRAVQRYPHVMFLWAWMIALLTIGGIASFLVGLAIAFPLLGHASWHAYRDIRQVITP